MSTKNARLTVLEALAQAKPEDLAEIDEKIEKLNQELDTLKTARRVLAAKFEPPEERKKPGPRRMSAEQRAAIGKGAQTRAYRVRCARYILHAGPTKPATLAKECEIPDGSMTAVTTHEWFDRQPDGVHLTAAGRQAVDDKDD